MLRVLIACLLLASLAQADRILIYPFGHCLNSHLLNAETLSEIIADRGHDVDFLVSTAYRSYDHHEASPFVNSSGINLVEFQAPSNYKPICEYDTIEFMLYTPLNIRFKSLTETMEKYCHNVLQDTALLKKLKSTHYDLLIVEALDPCSRILADFLDIPFIPLMTTGLGHLDGNPRPPSYIPSAISSYTSKMTFLQRIGNLITKVMYDTIPIVMGFDAPFEELKKRYDMNTSLSIANTYNRASLKLVNSDFSIEYPSPIEPDTVMVGGFAVQAPRPLPSALEEFMQSSGQHGVIVVSFGTLVKRYNMDWTRVFVEALSRLPQKVLWRYYGDHDAVMNMTGASSNIRLMRWLPQSDLLAHPKTKLFITHCGLNGMFETIHHGVPVIAIPLTGDQLNHASKMAEHLQMGIKLDIFNLDTQKLFDAARTVLTKPTYKTNALIASSRLRDHPLSAAERVAFWVDYVIRHGGAPHLKSTAHMLTWYQYLSLDVIFCVGLVLSLTLTIVLGTVYKLLALLMGKLAFFSISKVKVH